LTVALAAAGTALVAYETNFLGFRDAIVGAVDFIETGVSFITGTGSNSLAGDTIAAFDSLESQVGTTVANFKRDVKGAFKKLKNAVVGSGGEDSNGGIIGAFISGVISPFQTLKETLLGEGGNPDSSGLIGQVVGGIRTAFDELSKFLNNKFDLSEFKTTFDKAINPIKSMINGLIKKVNELLGLVDGVEAGNIPGLNGSDGDNKVARNITKVEELPNSTLRTLTETLGDRAEAGKLSSANENDLFALVAELRERIQEGRAIGEGVARDIDLSEIKGVENPAPEFSSVSEIRNAGAATGGFVASTGRAIIHEGERVVPKAQITDRGRVEVSSGNTMTIENLTVNANSRSGGRAAGRALKRELKRFDI
jgi:hypothetical protein